MHQYSSRLINMRLQKARLKPSAGRVLPLLSIAGAECLHTMGSHSRRAQRWDVGWFPRPLISSTASPGAREATEPPWGTAALWPGGVQGVQWGVSTPVLWGGGDGGHLGTWARQRMAPARGSPAGSRSCHSASNPGHKQVADISALPPGPWIKAERN